MPSSAHQDPLNRIPTKFRYFFLASLGCVGLGVLALWFDLKLAQPGVLEQIPGDANRIIKLSELFAHGFGVFLMLAGIWILDPGNRRCLLRLLACVLAPAIVINLAKLLVFRFRPLAYRGPDGSFHFPKTIAETWHGILAGGQFNTEYMTQSFASAHATTVWSLAIGLSWIYPRGRGLFFFVALLASTQRVMSLAHWSSDVCFGAAVAFLVGGAVLAFRKYKPEAPASESAA